MKAYCPWQENQKLLLGFNLTTSIGSQLSLNYAYDGLKRRLVICAPRHITLKCQEVTLTSFQFIGKVSPENTNNLLTHCLEEYYVQQITI